MQDAWLNESYAYKKKYDDKGTIFCMPFNKKKDGRVLLAVPGTVAVGI